MFENLNKTKAFCILVGLFCGSVMISNITAVKTFDWGILYLPCSTLIFPILYIINDILSEVYGYELTSKVIYLGLFINLIGVIIFQLAIWLPSTNPISLAFTSVLSMTPRLLVA